MSLAYIVIDNLQIPAQKFEEKNEALNVSKDKEVVVEDNNESYWVIDEENYAKVEAFGYSKVE
ncbi:hypothetical protein [Thalassobacillus sp. C254]|uniref:hypothetical protein n=1 Tax=Thalassobacillus sp. C254 TaxID=1225341 RepID=UPI0006CFF4C5|nr:hypothetical protein [Thalassobacillus sp. C254]